MVTDKTIKIKRSKYERELFDYTERRFKSAIMLFLLQQETEALASMTLSTQDQHIIHLHLHLVYLDQMHLHNRQTSVGVDDWRKCEGAWSDFYKSAGSLHSATQGVIVMVEHWHNEQFVLNHRGTAYEIKLGNGQEPISEMTISNKPDNGFRFGSGLMYQYLKKKYLTAEVQCDQTIDRQPDAK